MEILFLTISAVMVNFLAGFVAGRYLPYERSTVRIGQPTEESLEAARVAAEYRNFLSYDGTEQDEIVL
ncbi:MAG: hypothetical protein IJE65_05890 [Clostridia bacterium]|nr:hypothetical protein [Clostridia bacterium]